MSERTTTIARFDGPSALGIALETAPDAFGELRRSSSSEDDATLRLRLADEGYLYLPGYLSSTAVLAAREALIPALEQDDRLDVRDGVIRAGTRARREVAAEVALGCPELQHLLYGGAMVAIYERLFDEAVRHFDYTWLRAFPPGRASAPHMDSVFMNRGTKKLLTSWTPLGDIDRRLGGLAILAGSHKIHELVEGYASRDVDVLCVDEEGRASDRGSWNGALSDNPAELRRQLGLKWLTTDYQAGDLMIFTIFTAHVGLDNNSDTVRLSCDSRYLPASEPADPRWVGLDPSAHTERSKRTTIC